jgi:ribosome-associated protein
MIEVTRNIRLDESEIQERFIRASGPGGQNVNKLATAVQLRFDVRRSPSLPDPVRARLAIARKSAIARMLWNGSSR